MLGKRQMFPPKHGTDETFQLIHPGDESVEIPKVSVSSSYRKEQLASAWNHDKGYGT
jgi:hypothetical protein